jgi:serine/threonine protein kinase
MNGSVPVPGYRVLKAVGSGAAGSVFLAEDSSGEQVALKVVSRRGRGSRKACEELNREYRILSRLEHPGIPRAHGLHRSDDQLCLVREYCRGTSLRKIIQRAPREASRVLPELLERAGDILQHMHDRGYVHRDFKPENLVVDGAGQVFLVDMALAWRRRLLSGPPPLAGTPAYMAPELLAGRRPSPASDTYAFAVTAYEVLSGRLPYNGNSREEVLTAHRRGGALTPSRYNNSLSSEVDRLVMAGLHRESRERPNNLTVYGHRLARATGGNTTAPPQPAGRI